MCLSDYYHLQHEKDSYLTYNTNESYHCLVTNFTFFQYRNEIHGHKFAISKSDGMFSIETDQQHET